jgi:2-polyprenyl-3-methyl-5-hydroxy-6-metoxy-1,4-benzoquinol methylase
MSLPEDTYGTAKRLDFIAAIVRETRSRDILDIGCGTGMLLTLPLARAFPAIEIVGVDSDEHSLAWAREKAAAPNLGYTTLDTLAPGRRFGLVIASEVLEHVAEPARFLADLAGRVAPGGRLVVTVPNGFGAFEWMTLTEVMLNLSGLQSIIRRLLGRGRHAPAVAAPSVTLANSPHINFFGFRELGRLFAAGGFAVRRYRARTLLCGYIVDSLLARTPLIGWNAAVADRLPAWCVSGWMFELEPVRPAGENRWRRGAWSRFRKRLNERRWGLS